MLNFMDRSTISLLHQKGWANVEIADFLGHHRDTIARVLREPLDHVRDEGFVVDEFERARLGIVERLSAHKEA